MDKYQDLDISVTNILRAQRGSTLEMNRHENSLLLAHIEHGKALARQETFLVEKFDRQTKATNFQDLGIKTRTGISIPHYKDRE